MRVHSKRDQNMNVKGRRGCVEGWGGAITPCFDGSKQYQLFTIQSIKLRQMVLVGKQSVWKIRSLKPKLIAIQITFVTLHPLPPQPTPQTKILLQKNSYLRQTGTIDLLVEFNYIQYALWTKPSHVVFTLNHAR